MKKFFKKAVLWAGSVAIVASIIAFSVSSSKVTAQVSETIDLTPQKIEQLKADIVTRLASCESAGHTEDYGLVTFDQNASQSLSARNTPSFGILQFKVTTVMKYVHDRDGKDITGKEAILLALDASDAQALASWIIFKTDGGIYNWKNCADKLNLSPEITVIKKLSK